MIFQAILCEEKSVSAFAIKFCLKLGLYSSPNKQKTP